MLGESLGYPKAGDEWLKTVLIGGVLWLIGAFIFVTLLPVQGYFVRVLRSAANDEREPPEFDEWGDLFVDGIKMLVVNLVYVGVPMLLILFASVFVGVGLLAIGVEGGGAGVATGLGLLGALLAIVLVLVFVLAIYFLPAALANFAYEDDLGAAFDLGTIRRAAFTSDYFVALLLAFVVGVTLGLIATVLTFLLVGIFMLFYVQVSIYYLIGRGYAKGLDLEPGGPTGRDAGAAATVE